uniref:Uncharacterized protein n=1 Tax=Tanacetum cinerariifolium TaxID=118510 RepID=A0A699TUZ4_TANCI|nr:hypothetical protein [Tanacetum cinerariifolium]
MLHSHLTTLNAVSLVLDTFAAEGWGSEALLAGSGITEADLKRPDIRITTFQEMQPPARCRRAVRRRHDPRSRLRQTARTARRGIGARRGAAAG